MSHYHLASNVEHHHANKDCDLEQEVDEHSKRPHKVKMPLMAGMVGQSTCEVFRIGKCVSQTNAFISRSDSIYKLIILALIFRT